MKLVLNIPAAWSGDGFELAVGPIIGRPEAEFQWRQRAVRSQIPENATVKELESVDDKTERGWPVRLVEAEVRLGGEAIEHRLVCFYYLLEYAAVAIARAPTRAAFDEHRARLLESLMSAWPSWKGDEIASIAELLEDVEWGAVVGSESASS